ncbi:hydantoinase/oxoprolinase family protein [Marinibaculum pumilum]|uniref:Hydantoinase/oxoprolinase family protein n=1 Tax=Marinibaculum pumilum TaxID=1766165 RepID=A0ABV7L5F2_9PROT
MAYDVCIDIGGTFTDCIVAGPDGAARIFKASSTPGAFERGFMAALELAAGHYGLALRDFLGQVRQLVHGTTVTTNALVQGQTAPVALLCTAGHPDVLTLREAPRKRTWNWRTDYPGPFVPRNRTFEIGGRIDALGNEVAPLDEAAVADAVAVARRLEVAGIAVSYLWSIANPAHERRTRELIAAAWPEVPVTLGHEINPIPREYRRTISTAIDASLQPIFSTYLSRLEAALRDGGYGGELLVANCVGGMMPAAEIIAKPIYSVMSGPTLAPVAARALCDAPLIVVIDMGGTTLDVSAVRDGELVVAAEAMILPYDMLGLPKVDVRSVGAGGGSIAWVDAGGLLRVGPQSAGAEPGPAAYGRGGTAATVTDADVVLGIIDPDYFLGGSMRIDRAAAEQAVAGIAGRLGLSNVEAAYAIHTTCNHTMITAIEDVTINEGINPRDAWLVAGGGATAAHVAEMAQVLGVRGFTVPKHVAALSAFGGLISDLRWEAVASLHTSSRAFAAEAVDALLAELRDRCTVFLAGAGVAAEDRRIAWSFQGRYETQSWEIAVPFDLPEGGLQASDIARLTAAFHAAHEAIYGFKEEGDPIAITTWKAMAIGRNARAGERPAAAGAEQPPPPPKGQRNVYLRDAGGMREVPVYDGTVFRPGMVLAGPAVIEEPTTTLLLLPGMRARVDGGGNYLVEVSA